MIKKGCKNNISRNAIKKNQLLFFLNASKETNQDIQKLACK